MWIYKFAFLSVLIHILARKKMSHSNTQEIHAIGYLGILLWQRVVFQVHICESLIWILILITPMSTQFHIQNTLKIPFRENLDKQWRNI